MSEPYAGPKNGDYVAYLEHLERVQWAQIAATAAQSGATLPDLPRNQGTRADRSDRNKPDGERKALNSAQARAVREALAAAGREDGGALRQARAALLPIAIGFAIAMFGLIAEGGLILLLIGAVIAFSGIRKLFKSLSATAQSVRAATQVQQAGFTQTTARQR